MTSFNHLPLYLLCLNREGKRAIALYQKYRMELLTSEVSSATVLAGEAGQWREPVICLQVNVISFQDFSQRGVGRWQSAMISSPEIPASARISGLMVPPLHRRASLLLAGALRSPTEERKIPECGPQPWYSYFYLDGLEIYLELC